MRSFFIITFGCQMNKNDSERIASYLLENNWRRAKKIESAELIIINACAVRQSAVDRIYGLIPKFKTLKEKNKNLKTIITGCILEKDKKKLRGSFDYILNIKTLPRWEKIISEADFSESNDAENISYLDIKPSYQSKIIGFVPVSTGCNMRCSYCAVPFTRGKEINRDHRKIIKEAKELISSGYKEIWLLGQIVNSYKSPSNYKIGLAEIIEKLNSINGNFWIKMTSPHPSFFNKKLIEAMAKSEKFASYLNLPIQSGSDKILKLMKRPYTANDYTAMVNSLRKSYSDFRQGVKKEISISTDIIVGFPGEIEKDFEKTKKIMEEIKFDMAYIAQFSPRPGTEAEKMKDDVSKKEKERREKMLTEILKKTALENNKKFIGKIEKTLITKKKGEKLLGVSFHQKNIITKGSKSLIGKFVLVKIKKASPWHLVGEIQNNG